MEHAVLKQSSGRVCQGQPFDKLSPAEVFARHVPLFFLFLSVSFALPVFAYQSPGQPSGFVNDFAGAFSADQKTSLETKLSLLEKSTGVEVSIVTISGLGDETIETYAVKLFEEWGIGKAKRDNGLLILVSPGDREARIEIGYGLEPIITDAVSSVIMRNVMIPAFKESNYYGSIDSALDVIVGLIKGDTKIEGYMQSLVKSEKSNNGGGINWPEVLIFFLIIVIQLIPVIIYSKSWWLGGVVGFFLGLLIFYSFLAGLVVALIGLVADYLLSKKFGGKRPPGTAGGVWFGGMGGGRGWGGGGFGGFGGGFSGGGGSSGRW